MSEQLAWLKPLEPFTVLTPADEAGWRELLLLCGKSSDFGSLVGVARASGARSVVIENGYPDIDQASEAGYWPRAFPIPHTDVHRVHFFASPVEGDFGSHRQQGYLGYAVIARPLGRLVRALVKPPPCLDPADPRPCSHCEPPGGEAVAFEGTVAAATETVELFGFAYEVRGVPYCGQNAWHLQCGHAAAWTCLFTAFLEGRAPRTTIGDAVEAGAAAEVDVQRAVSSTGTNYFQLQRIFTARGMPALFYEIPELTADKRLKLHGLRGADRGRTVEVVLRTVCNYINSGFPVVASTREHTVTLVGWRRRGGPDGEIELIYSDSDQVYGIVPASRIDQAQWTALMVPLPPEVVLTGESAQADAHQALTDLQGFIADAVSEEGAALAAEAAAEVARLLADRRLSLRLELKRRHGYRAAVRAQAPSRGEELVEALAMVRLPSWVWVVEAQDCEARERGEDSVLAEFVFDTTSPDDSPQFASVSIGRLTWLDWPYDPRSMPAVVEHERTSAGPRWRSQINGPSDAALDAAQPLEALPAP
jgi:hypothetical protein